MTVKDLLGDLNEMIQHGVLQRDDPVFAVDVSPSGFEIEIEPGKSRDLLLRKALGVTGIGPAYSQTGEDCQTRKCVIQVEAERLKENREEAKKIFSGCGYKPDKNFCVDCHGWAGSIPDYYWVKDSKSKESFKCSECGRIFRCVRRDMDGL